MQCHIYISIQITTTEQKYSILELNWHVPKCKCLNRLNASKYRILVLYFIMVCRQSKQKNSSTNILAITINTSQNNKIYNVHKIAAGSRHMPRLRGSSSESGSLLSRAGKGKASLCSAMLSTCKDCPAYQNREEKMLTKTWHQNHSLPRQRRQKFDRGGTSTQKCVLCKINEKLKCANVPSILPL